MLTFWGGGGGVVCWQTNEEVITERVTERMSRTPDTEPAGNEGKRKKSYACRACARRPGPLVEWGDHEVRAGQVSVPIGTSCRDCARLWTECFPHMGFEQWADWSATEDHCGMLSCSEVGTWPKISQQCEL